MTSTSLITSAFTRTAAMRAQGLGMPNHPVVVLPHPIASRRAEEAKAMVEEHLDAIVAALTLGGSNG